MTCDRCRECQDKGNRFCIYCGERLDRPIPGQGCSHCDECRINGDRFCKYCGKPLTVTREGCDRCDECIENGDKFCRYCGKSLVVPENPLLAIGFVVGIVTAIIASFTLIFEYAVALWGIPQVWPHLPDITSSLILVVPTIVTIVEFSGIPAQIYYILLLLAVAASLGFYFYKAFDPAIRLKKGDNKTIRNTAFFEVPVLFCTLLFWELMMAFVLTALGIKMEGLPDRDTWVWMYDLLEAPVWEEIITRVLYIGVPMALIALIKNREGKTSARYLIGGFGLSKPAVVLIFFSAFMFGAGHLNNWGAWKFFPTFVFGLIAGYLFCRYGIYACVVIHFLTDYMSAGSWLTGSDLSLTYLVMIMLAFACVPYTYIYLKRGVLALKDIFLDQSKDLR